DRKSTRLNSSHVAISYAVFCLKKNFRQTLFKLIERFKNSATSSFVWLLARGETGAVDTVVYVVVQKTRELRVLGVDFFRKKIQIFVSGKVVEHIVEHATDVVLAIIDDPARFLVPDNRHRDTLIIIRVGC